MRTLRLAPLALIALIAIALTDSNASAQIQPTKVAIANPAKIFQELKETGDLRKAMEAKEQQVKNTQFEKQQKIKDLQARRDQLKSDSAGYAEANRDLMQAAVDYEVWGKMIQVEVQNDQKRQLLGIFTRITNAVSEVATQKGIDLVVTDQRPEIPENLDAVNVDQLRGLINSRNVLFFKPQIDISADVVAALNAKYEKGQ
ncbi:MAG: OmpH family outer membrane protein [Anaerolineae bacterium]|nr:OmpH family outer membrane protein [Phycisphaerae bacterium]